MFMTSKMHENLKLNPPYCEEIYVQVQSSWLGTARRVECTKIIIITTGE